MYVVTVLGLPRRARMYLIYGNSINMSSTQTKDFTDDLSELMDEVPEEEISDGGDSNESDTTLDNDITLVDEEGPYTLGQDNDDTVTK